MSHLATGNHASGVKTVGNAMHGDATPTGSIFTFAYPRFRRAPAGPGVRAAALRTSAPMNRS